MDFGQQVVVVCTRQGAEPVLEQAIEAEGYQVQFVPSATDALATADGNTCAAVAFPLDGTGAEAIGPLLGEAARQDIGRRVEICPNSNLRKDAFRTVYQRAVSEAERDPARTRAGAAQACPDKREFLRRVMSH